MAKSGLGYMATGALRESKQYGAAQTAAGGAGQVLAGMREAGFIDAGLTTAMGGLASELQRQALEAAKASGLGDEEATKASFGAINDILREQLNASLASGQELDANTKALIEEAKKNGITIVADTALQQLAIEKLALAELQKLNGTGVAPPPNYRDTTMGGDPDYSSARGFGEFRPKRIRGGARFRVHDGEGVIVFDRNSMDKYYSSARGYGEYRDDGRYREPGGGGGGSSPAPMPGGGVGPGDAATEVRMLAQELRERTPAVIVNTNTTVAPQIDPAMSTQTQQEAVNIMVEGVERAIRQGKPGLVTAIRRAVGAPTR
jgi:hypothetical protein